jgi:hypothetical protein
LNWVFYEFKASDIGRTFDEYGRPMQIYDDDLDDIFSRSDFGHEED